VSKQISKVDDLRNSIQALGPQFKSALPAHIPVEKFSRVLMTAISTNPALQDASRNSLFAACMKLAQSGLLPDGSEAAIVTFKSKDGVTATAMPMIKGILKLVRNSGELASITANVVYKNDTFKYWIDEGGEKINHEPNLGSDRGDIILVYAIARTKDGAVYAEVMTKQEIDAIRNSSRSRDGGPWSTWYGEMAKKSVIRRLSKKLPMSTDLDIAVTADDNLYEPIQTTQPEPEPITVSAPKTKSKKLAEVIEAEATPEPEPKKVKNYAPGSDDTPMPSAEDVPL